MIRQLTYGRCSLLLLAAVAVILSAAGCSVLRGPPAPRAQLSPDSMEVLERALLRVRPGYPSQQHAVRAGVYDVSVVEDGRDRATPDPASSPAAPAEQGRWVVQVAAYDSFEEAARAERVLRGEFPEWPTRIERGPGVYRLALGAWTTQREAERALRGIRRRYTDAWMRTAGEIVR